MAQAAPTVSFRGSVHEYYEKWTTSPNVTPSAATQDVSPLQNSVQSYGFLRSVDIRLRNITAGTGGNFPTVSDYPAKIISQISLTDPNGAEVYGGPTYSGYETYLAEKYGAYKAVNDPTLSSMYSAAVTAPTFYWRIPLELSESSGLGSLPNFDAQSPYKLKTIMDASTNIWLTAPTTIPVQAFDFIIRAWTQPDNTNKQSGVQQTMFPPGIGQNIWGVQGIGCTVQHWTLSTPSVTASTAMVASLIRKGNIDRTLVYVTRNSSGARISFATGFPNPVTFQIDGAPLYLNIDPQVMYERWWRREVGQAGSTNVTADLGVLPDLYSNIDGINIQGVDGTLGMQGFLGTNQASRMELSGTWGASVSTLQCLTNDVNGVSLEGSMYAWSFGNQLMSPSPPSVRSGAG
jgi:hypothetical protein